MWSYYNPSNIIFKTGALDHLSSLNIIEKKNIAYLPIQIQFLKSMFKKS